MPDLIAPDLFRRIIADEAARAIREAPDSEPLAVLVEGMGAVPTTAEGRFAAVDSAARSPEWKLEGRALVRATAGRQAEAARSEFDRLDGLHRRAVEQSHREPIERLREQMQGADFSARLAFIWSTFRGLPPEERQRVLSAEGGDIEVKAAVLIMPRIGAAADLTGTERDDLLRSVLDTEQTAKFDASVRYGAALARAESVLVQLEAWVAGLGGGSGPSAPASEPESIESILARSTAANAV
jgi:hypothetical protein